MCYKSPIEIICSGLKTEIDGEIVRAVHKYDINVDKEELLKMLKYDRGQYDEGYADGKRDATPDPNGCGYCTDYEPLPREFIHGEPVGKVFDSVIRSDEAGLWHIEPTSGPDIGIKFCPMCGRLLPQDPTRD